MKQKLLLSLYQQPQSVFSMPEISLLFPQIPYNSLKRRLSYFAKTGAIKKLRRGLYAKNKFDPMELANKLYTPSYISLETVLVKAGIIFQYYKSIFSASYVSRTVKVAASTLVYKRMKKEILVNKTGLEEQGKITIATPERAFLDAVFLYKNYHFDNLDSLDWNKIRQLQLIYNSLTLNRRIEEYYQIYKEENV